MSENKKVSIIEGTITVLYGFVILFLTTLALFFFRGIEEVELFEKATFYWTFLAIGLITVLALAILEYLVSTGFFNEEKFGWAKLYIWEPEESILGIVGLGKFITLKRVIHFSIIFSLLLGLLGVITQTFFISLPPYELQVSETGQLILNTEPVAFSETVTVIILISLVYGITSWYFRKLGMENIGSKVLVFMIVIIMITLIWIALHTARYGISTAIGFTAMFGFFGTILTVMVGSPIPLYFWHVSNNLFLKATDIFARGNVKIFLITFLIVYIVTLIAIKIYKTIKQR